MTPYLTPLQRTAAFAFSAVTYGLAFLSDGSALKAQPAANSLRVAPLVLPTTLAIAASIRRDPFAFTPRPQRLAEPAAPAGTGDANAGFAPVPPGLTVPSIDGLGQAEGPSRSISLKATIAGEQPVAYLQDGQRMTIVRPGDAIEGLRVRLIDLRGVAFDDGTRLELPERSGAAERARATVLPARGTAAAEAAPTATPAPASAGGGAAGSGPLHDGPTPGQLPTPKPGSYPLGTRPTSDPAAPTAFPYPYPYAPH
jgi:hypothetical protein